jgi:hypothetical protein
MVLGNEENKKGILTIVSAVLYMVQHAKKKTKV